MDTQSATRASAARIAKWFVSGGRPADAVAVLAAWAARGPNDAEGQALLAEALRIDPAAPVAKAAFDRMEGVAPGSSANAAPAPASHALDEAIRKYSEGEISRLEREIGRPSFRKAQVGFNNNLNFGGRVFHVQTEDSGLDKPHVITHLFADGGRVIKSHKRSYAADVGREDVATYVRGLMKAQHLEMVLLLREGKFDEILAGRAIGGLETLQQPPNADIRRLKKGKDETTSRPPSAAPPAPGRPPEGSLAAGRPLDAELQAEPAAAPVALPPRVPRTTRAYEATPKLPPPAPAKVRVRLQVVRSLTGGPTSYEPLGDEVLIGKSGAVSLPGERFCSAREAILRWKEGRLTIENCEGGNGVFVRVRTPAELEMGDEFIVGDQLLRVQENPAPDVSPGVGPTYFYSSPTWPGTFRVAQIYEGGREGACMTARGTTLIVGRGVADLIITRDPLLDDQHCMVEEQAGVLVLSDLGSRTGVFVRLDGEHPLQEGDEMVVGRTRLRVQIRG